MSYALLQCSLPLWINNNGKFIPKCIYLRRGSISGKPITKPVNFNRKLNKPLFLWMDVQDGAFVPQILPFFFPGYVSFSYSTGFQFPRDWTLWIRLPPKQDIPPTSVRRGDPRYASTPAGDLDVTEGGQCASASRGGVCRLTWLYRAQMCSAVFPEAFCAHISAP